MSKIKILVVDDHVLMRDGIRAMLSPHDDIEIVGEASEGNEAIEKARELAGRSGVKIETLMKQGHAGNEIVRAAADLDADLVIVGSHGKSDVDRLLLGSVSSFVVSNSGKTVMVVRPSQK